jgi:hypothetical protein
MFIRPAYNFLSFASFLPRVADLLTAGTEIFSLRARDDIGPYSVTPMILRVSHFIFGLLRRSQTKKSGVKCLNRELTVAGFGGLW